MRDKELRKYLGIGEHPNNKLFAKHAERFDFRATKHYVAEELNDALSTVWEEINSLREDVNEVDEELFGAYEQYEINGGLDFSEWTPEPMPSKKKTRIDKLEDKLNALVEYLGVDYKEECEEKYPKFVKKGKRGLNEKDKNKQANRIKRAC